MQRILDGRTRGFTLVELLVALSILLVAVMGLVPLFVYTAQASQMSTARLVGTKLASGWLEKIRAMPYDRIGVAGSNPDGDIPDQIAPQTIGNNTYHTVIHVYWQTDPSNTGTYYNNYKKVTITVTVASVFSGKQVVCATLASQVTPEGEERLCPGGNLKVSARRYWKNPKGGQDPVEGVRVSIDNGPFSYTDDQGNALFTGISLNTSPQAFHLTIDGSQVGMMLEPGTNNQVNLSNSVLTPFPITVDYPCHLEIKLVDPQHNHVQFSGSLKLQHSVVGAARTAVNLNGTDFISAAASGSLWPAGEATDPVSSYSLDLSGLQGRDEQGVTRNYSDYSFNVIKFDNPGQTRLLTITLIANQP